LNLELSSVKGKVLSNNEVTEIIKSTAVEINNKFIVTVRRSAAK